MLQENDSNEVVLEVTKRSGDVKTEIVRRHLVRRSDDDAGTTAILGSIVRPEREEGRRRAERRQRAKNARYGRYGQRAA